MSELEFTEVAAMIVSFYMGWFFGHYRASQHIHGEIVKALGKALINSFPKNATGGEDE